MTVASEIDRKVIARLYTALDLPKQISAIATLGDQLTLLARDTYDSSGGVTDSVRLRNFNEAQNRVLGQLIGLLAQTDKRYPDDVFANIVVDQLDLLHLSSDLWHKIIISA